MGRQGQPPQPEHLSQEVQFSQQQQQQQQQQPASAAPKHYGIFRRRGPMPLPASPPPLPQQIQQQAFPPPPGLQALAGPDGAPLQTPPPPQPPRDAQPMQELVGGNWLFVVFLPYFVATALQDTHLRIGLMVATGISVGVLLLGLLVFVINLRKVFPHILELMMPIIYAVQLGVSYHSSSYEKEISRTYPFITHSALAGTCLLSLLVCYPVGYQTAQELVHKMYMTHPAVHRVGLYTTAALTASLVTSCLLYLAPLCVGVDDQHWSALNLIFRLIYPPLATAAALLFVRFFPDAALPALAVVHGLNRKPQQNLPSYLVDVMARRPPAILDASMYQSTADAATKAREATLMRRASPYASPPAPLHPSPLTPRYYPGAPAPPPPPPPHSGVGSLPGNQLNPGYATQGYGRGVGGGPAALLPGGAEQSVYTYYAAGPPAEPPLAVYAVYGSYEALSTAGQQQQQQQLAPSVQALSYGGAALTPNPALLRPYGDKVSAGYAVARPRYMYGSAGGAAGAHVPGHDPRVGGVTAPGRGYASAGGAGPYGVNMPLRALASDYPLGPMAAPGLLPPPPPPPDAIVTGQVAPPPTFGRHPPLKPLHAGGGSVGGEYQQQPHHQLLYAGTGPPLAGRVYDGKVSLMPAADPNGVEYGLGAEVLQRDAEGPSYGMPGGAAAAFQPPPAPTRFGLDAETAAAPSPAAYDMPGGGGYEGGAGQLSAQGSMYGLQAEPQAPPPPYRPQSPLGGGLDVRHMPAAADGSSERFGLAAEVTPSSPYRRQVPPGPHLPEPVLRRAPSPLGRLRPAEEPRGGEAYFGLDAEVGL